jgi:hypothetical protein
MGNRLPNISDKHKICIICEGNEEYKYLEKLISLHVWNDAYSVSLVNAQGNGNIPARYQDRYQSDSYEVVLVFCDTEKKPYEQYSDIKRKINEFHGIDNASDEVVIFANPCTLQIVIKHWTNKMIKTPAKPVNSSLIEEYTGVVNYKARVDQIDAIMELINKENYVQMKSRLKGSGTDDSVLGSTNVMRFLQYFEGYDCGWIKRINNKLED